MKYESKGKKLSLFTDNITIYTENPKQPVDKLLDLSEVSWYKINIQIWIVFCIQIRNTNWNFKKYSLQEHKNVKYLRLYLIKDV